MTDLKEIIRAVREPLQNLLNEKHGSLNQEQRNALEAALQELDILSQEVED